MKQFLIRVTEIFQQTLLIVRNTRILHMLAEETHSYSNLFTSNRQS